MQEDSIFNNLTDSQKKELEFLVTSFLADNDISDKERNFLHEKAVEFGIDVTCFDEYINFRLKQSIDNVERKRKAEQSLYGLLDIFLENNDLTEDNRNHLTSKARDLGIDPVKFNEQIDEKLNRQNNQQYASGTSVPSEIDSKGSEQSTANNHKGHKKVRPLSILIPLFITAACVLFFLKIYDTPQERPIPLSTYVEHNPNFVFQTASMRKYLVLGTPSGTSDKFEKLQVFQVKATADFSFDMTKLKVKNEEVTKQELILSYISDTYFPLSVDVDISQGDIVEIEKIDPRKISKEEAEAIAKPTSVAAGAFGTLVGGKLGATIGSVWGVAGKWIGGGIGAVTAGAATGYKTCVWTRDILCGLQLSSNISVSQSEEFITASKAIIAAEMLDLNLTNKDDMLKLRKKYETNIQEQIQYLGERLGWKTIKIEFEYTGN